MSSLDFINKVYALACGIKVIVVIWTFYNLPPPYRLTVLRWTGLFVFSFFLLTFLSPDSFLTHLCAHRCDSAWFFTCGKAWMEGMTPYIDFADSKGPLLWLIYGIGYLLSPTSYTGVFWLSVLAYTVTFGTVWLTARLFVGRREALLVLVMMPALMLYRGIHEEVRAEDFCMPWICIGLYCICRSLLSKQGTSVRKYAFWLGVGMAWCLLVKWNLFVLMGGMALVVLGVSFGRKRVDGLFFGLLGIATLTLPFMVYFLWKGNFMAMVQEYFINTFLITGRGDDPGESRTVFYTFLTNRMSACYNMILAGAFVGMFLFCRRFCMAYWLMLGFVPFFLFLEFEPCISHYFTIVMPFYLFFLLSIVSYFSQWIGRCPRIVFAAVVACVLMVGTAYNTRWSRFVFFPSEDQERWDEVQSVLRRKPYSRILVGKDYGYGLLTRALPACKYWSLQLNASNDMKENRRQAMRARKPDFILLVSKGNGVQQAQYDDPQFFDVLRESGYHQCHVTVVKNGKAVKKAVPVYAKE